MDTTTLLQLAVSLGLGLLVGLQREWRAESLLGIRSFALVTLLGTLCGLLAADAGWVVPAGLLALGALLVIENRTRVESGELRPGPTSEIAALVMFLVGVAVVRLPLELGVVLGGAVAVLLQWERPLHGFAERIGPHEMRSIFRLALIALVILPALPDADWGPYGVLNPFDVWRMVVLIAGVSVVGWLALGFLGARVGTLLAGVLGGLVSSTATSVAYARRSRLDPDGSKAAALVVLTASLVVFPRVLLELGVVAPAVLSDLAPPLLAMTAWMTLVLVVAFLRRGPQAAASTAPEDPSSLGTALAFGLVYAVVLVAVAYAQHRFGRSGLYVVSVLSGLTDVDAITLSTAQLVRSGGLAADTAWRMVLVGALANLAFKGLVVAAIGSRALARRVGALFLLSIAGGTGILAFWPPVAA